MPIIERGELDRKLAAGGRLALVWLRRIFVEEWGLKLLALVITLGIWWAVSGQRNPVTVRIDGVQLSYRLPGQLEFGNEPRREVEVTLSGPERLLQRINSHDLVAFVDLSDYKAGDRMVNLTPDRITMGLPQGVRVDEIEPGHVPIRLELRTEANIAIESKVEGIVADGYEMRGITFSPEKIRVRGPESHIANLKFAPTELIHLAGRKDTFTVPEVAVDISDRKVNILDPVVSVTVLIGEKRVEKTLSGVTVTSGDERNPSPAVTTVMLYGPQSAINNLQASDIKVRLVEGDDGHLTPRLILPNGMNPDVELRSTKPSRFVIGK